jgi:hypothetical protein
MEPRESDLRPKELPTSRFGRILNAVAAFARRIRNAWNLARIGGRR